VLILSNKGMSENTFWFIKENINRIEVNEKKGVVLTPKGTNGSLCKSTGYLRVKLNGKNIPVHQILSVYYFDDKCIGLQVNHKDGNKLNNLKENLEVVTQKENIKHQWETGLCVPHEAANCKLSDEDVEYIRLNHVKGKRKGENTTAYMAKKFNVHKNTIYNVINGTLYNGLKS